MRRTGTIAIALAGAMLVPAAADAGDFAQFRPIGFSSDGAVFAYEEFGIQDGSGSAYSNIYFVDTVKDAFLPGTPIRVQAQENDSSLRRVRAESAAKATPLVARYSLNDHPGQLVALNPISEIGPEPHSIRYDAFPIEPRLGRSYALNLTEIPAPVPDACQDFLEKGIGFRLEFTEKAGEPASETVYTDTRIPESRGCPTGYRIAGVVTYNGAPRAVHMAMVMVLRVGFEGPDGRWLAVPLKP